MSMFWIGFLAGMTIPGLALAWFLFWIPKPSGKPVEDPFSSETHT